MSNIWKHVAGKLGIDSECGVSLVEYGLIAGLIGVAVLSAISLVGTSLGSTMTSIAQHLPGMN